MKRNLLTVILALVMFPLVGCIEEELEFTLNPDGSGKVSFRRISPGSSPDMELEALVKEARGVEGWKDLSTDVLDDGRGIVEGTAYFPDVRKLKLQKGKDNGLFDNIALTEKEDGSLQLTLSDPEPIEKAKTIEGTPPSPPSSEKEIEAQMKQKRLEYGAQRVFMEEMFTSLRLQGTFNLPGTISSTSVFQKKSERQVLLALEGASILQAYDEVMADDVLLREAILGGEDVMKKALEAKVVGEQKEPEVVVSAPLKTLFDYGAEVAAALDSTAALAALEGEKKEGDGGPGEVAEAPPIEVQNASASAKWNTTYYSSKGGKTEEKKLIEMKVILEGDEAAASFMVGKLKIATLRADTGVYLKTRESSGRGNDIFGNLIPVKRSGAFANSPEGGVGFEIELDPDGQQVGSLEEVSGTVTLRTSGSSREVLVPLAGIVPLTGDYLMPDFKGVPQPDLKESSLKFALWKPSYDENYVVYFQSTKGGALQRIKMVELLSGGEEGVKLQQPSAGRAGNIYFSQFSIPAADYEASQESQLKVVLRENITDRKTSFKVGPIPVQ
jgi:hypothetical protein